MLQGIIDYFNYWFTKIKYLKNLCHSSLFLQTFPREGARVQSEEQANQRNPPNLPGRFVPQYHNPEEKSWNHSSKEIYCQAKERERFN